MVQISKHLIYIFRIDSSVGDFNCTFGVFINLISTYNGGSIYFDHQGYKIQLNHCYFIGNQAANRGGAIAIGKASLFALSFSCFNSNNAPYSHNIFMDVLSKNELVSFSINDISEIGGKSQHGTLFSSSKHSLCKHNNMTGFNGNVTYYVHYSKGNIELLRLIVANSTTKTLLGTNTFSGKISFKDSFFFNSFTKFFYFMNNKTDLVSFEDSIFVFDYEPNLNKDNYNVTITKCVSNKKLNGFTYEANPKIPQHKFENCEERKSATSCSREQYHFLTMLLPLYPVNSHHKSNTKKRLLVNIFN